MSEPITIDLTARAAAEDQARRAALLTGDRGIDIIVVDDQPDHESGWFSRHLSGHRRLSLESVHELQRFLDGDRLPNLPDPPYEPELAILDLSLGAGQPDGLQALDTLRQHPRTRDLPAILNTNGLGDYRDMLAVIAAQLNGGAIPVAQKSKSDGPAVREHARHIAHARQADLPWPLFKAAPKPMLHVKEVIWHGDKSRPACSTTCWTCPGSVPTGRRWPGTRTTPTPPSRPAGDTVPSRMTRTAGGRTTPGLLPNSSDPSPSPGRWPANACTSSMDG